MRFIKLCNCNQGFLNAIFATITIFLSAIAICISITAIKHQNKIALFEKRIQVYNDLDDYINDQLTSWEFVLTEIKLFHQYTPAYIEALFDSKTKDFRVYLKNVSKQIDKLRGDYRHAQSKGSCNGRDENEIEDEIQKLIDDVETRFYKLKGDTFSKYLKL